MYYLYQIKYKGTDTPLTEGYIGVTRKISTRWRQHKRDANGVRSSAKIHQLMYKAGLDKFEIIELFSGTKDEMYAKELELRPVDNIGWNTLPGGGKFPGQKKGFKMSPEAKAKMSKAKKGHNTNKGTNNPKWKGFYVVNGIEYNTQALAAEAAGMSVTKFNKLVKRNVPGYEFIPRTERGL